MRSFAAGLLFLLVLLPMASGRAGSLADAYGRGATRALVGNGRLTAGIDVRGRLVSCRWPSPGHVELLHNREGSGATTGWGRTTDDSWQWLAEGNGQGALSYLEAGIPIVVYEETLPSAQGALRHLYLVHPERDMLALRIEYEESAGPIAWRQGFRTSTRPPDHLPVTEWTSTTETIPSEQTSLSPETGHVMCLADTAQSPVGIWLGHKEVVNTDLALHTTTVFISFGPDRQTVSDDLSWANSTGWKALVEQTRSYWESVQNSSVLPKTNIPQLDSDLRRCLTELLLCRDQESGAVVRLPEARPPGALDTPWLGRWVEAAFDTCGHREFATQHLRFLAEAMLDRAGTAAPLPLALYADGRPAAPPALVDLEGGASFVYSVRRHANGMPDAQRKAFLEEMWPAVEAVGDFFVNWQDAGSDWPAPAFDRELWRDTKSLEHLLVAREAIHKALGIAGELRREKPRWQTRARRLHALTILNVLDEEGRWKAPLLSPYAPREWLENDTPRLEQLRTSLLEKAGTNAGLDTLLNTAVLTEIWPQNTPLRDELRKAFPIMVHNTREQTLDSAAAALCLYTASLLY